jgi:TRAP-type transport system small permease protein
MDHLGGREAMKKLLETINALVLLIMFLLVMVTVVFRNILEIPSSWSQELSEYIFVFIVFIGSAAVMKEQGHIGIDTVAVLLPAKAQRIVRIIVRISIMPFLYVLITGSFPNIAATWNNYLPTVPWFRMGVIYLVVLISGIIMAFYLLVNLVQDIRGKFTPITLVDEYGPHESHDEEGEQ